MHFSLKYFFSNHMYKLTILHSFVKKCKKVREEKLIKNIKKTIKELAKKMYQKDIQRMIKKIVKSSGVYFSAHILRHMFAHQMIDAGLDLYKLKEILGHSSITTTQRYMSASRESIITLLLGGLLFLYILFV